MERFIVSEKSYNYQISKILKEQILEAMVEGMPDSNILFIGGI